MSTVVAASVSHVGNVREHNEDSLLIDEERQIFIVADGMGGHAAGEVASAAAVGRVHEAWTSVSMRRRAEAYARAGGTEARRKLLQAVREGVVAAHLDIVQRAREDDSKHGMGTTFTGFLIAGGEAVFAHAGDSRAYLHRDGIAIQLTEDHTVLARMHAAGIPSAEMGGKSRWQGVLTNALGMGDATRVATFLVPLYSGDRFLLCSDGVHDYFDENELAESLAKAPSPARAANRLVELALERGGHDNATAVVVKVVEAGETVVPPEQRDRDQRALARCPLLSSLTPQERLRALRITTHRDLRPGKQLAGIALGGRVAYIVLEGQVSAPRAQTLGPGDVVYPDGLIEGTTFSEEEACTAVGDARLLVIRREDFAELTEEEADLGVKLYARLATLMSTKPGA